MEVPGVRVQERRESPEAVQQQPQTRPKTPALNVPPGTREVFNPATHTPAENMVALPPDTKIVYDPRVEESRGRAMSYIKDYVERSDDPQGASAKINASVHFARELDMDPALVFEQFDTIVEQVYGRKMDPLSAWETIGLSWKTGTMNTELGLLSSQQMMNVIATGQYDEALQGKIDKHKAAMPPVDEQRRAIPVQAVKSLFEMMPTWLEGAERGTQRGLAYGAGGAAVTALAGQAGPQAVLPEEVVTVPAAFIALYGVGQVSGALENIWKIEAGLAFEEIASLEDENGEKINPRIAAAASFGVGAVNAAIEMFQIGNIPGVDRIIASATRKATKRLLVSGGLKEVAKRALRTYGTSIVTETAQEVAQESTNLFMSEVAKEINNQVNGTSFTQVQADEVISRLGETAKQSALAFSIMGIPGTVTGSIQDRTAQLRFQEDVRGKVTQAEQVRDNIAKALTEEPLAPGKTPDEVVVEYLQNATNEEVDALIDTLGSQEAPVERQAWEMTAEEYTANQAPKQAKSVTPGLYTPAQEKVISAVMERSNLDERQAGLVSMFMEMGARGRGMALGEFVDTYYTNEIFSEATIKQTPDGQEAKGYWQIVENAKNLIAIGEKADFGTFIHEIGHSFFPYLDDAQTQKVREWTGFTGENWYSPEGKQAQEQFADGFIEYLKTGEAVDAETRSLFQQFKNFLQEIYGYLSRTLQLNDGIRDVYSQLLGLDTDQASARERVEETARKVKAEVDQAFNKATERIQNEIDEAMPLFHVSAYHGSPHTFDRFSTEKMGTGEGVQAFGYGLYFTSESGIAEWYARKLAGEEGLKYRIAGKKYTQGEIPNNLRFQIRMYEKAPTEERKTIMLDTIRKEIEKSQDDAQLRILNEIDQALSTSESTPDLAGIEREVPRNLYRVSLFKDKDPAEYTWLEWYDPIPAESAKKIRAYLEAAPQNDFQATVQSFINQGDFGVTLSDLQQSLGEETGEAFYRLLSRAVGAPKDASKMLHAAGIDGIKYPAQSLATGKIDYSQGTNYVVFDENAVNVEDHILFQTSAHEEAVQQAVAEGKPVPDSVLQEYADRDWAQAELARRVGEDPIPESMQYLYDEARDRDDKDSFRTYLETFFFDDEELSQLSQEEFSQIVDTVWGAVHEKYLSRSDANDQFLEAMQEKHVMENALYELVQNGFTGGFGLNKVETSIILRIGAEKPLSEKQYAYLLGQLQDHPERYREALSFYDPAHKDSGQIRYEQMMEELDAAKEQDREDQRKADRLRLAVMKELGISSPDEIDDKLFKKFMKGKAKYQEVQDAYRKSQREVADLEKQVAKMDKEILDDERRIRKMSEAHSKVLKENQNIKRTARSEASKEFARLKEMQAEKKKALREQRAMKDQMRRLAKLIMKKPGPSIHLEEKRAIRAIQETIDPNFRSAKTLQKRRDALLKEAVGLEVPQEILDIAQKRTLNDFTMEDLERVYSHVMGLTRIGRAKRDAEVAIEKKEAQMVAGKIISQILAGEALDLQIPTNAKETRKGTIKKTIITGKLEGWKPLRIFEWLDGKSNGEMARYFYWKENGLTNETIRAVNNRRDAMQNALNSLGIEARTLGREIGGPKGTYTADQVLSFYVGVQNRLKMEALMQSEGMSAPQLQLYIAKLTPQEKALGDAIIQDYSDNYERLEKAYNVYTNEELGSQEAYTPIITTESDAEPLDQQLAKHILGKEGVGNRYTEKGFTKERKGGSLAIRLGELSIWQDQIGKQEHFISHAHYVRQLNRVLANRNLSIAMKQKQDYEVYKWLKQYVSDIAQYNIHTPVTLAEKVLAGWRKRLSVVHLSLNLPVIGRQVWSYPNVLGYADADIWARTPLEFAGKPAEITKFVEERSPQVKERSMETVFEEISALNRGKSENTRRRIAEAPMKWISAVDKGTCVITWKAAYDTNIRKQQKEIDAGRRGMINEDEAIRHADTAFLKTQPQARAKDLAWIYRQGEAAKMFLMFSQQLNQLWNITTADMPMFWREKNWKMLAYQFSGYMMSAIAMGVFARKRLPNDIGELGEDFIVQVLNTIPLIGREIVSLAQGWDVSNPSPFTSMENMWRGFDAMKGMIEEGPNEKDLKKMVRYGGQFAAEVMGLPFTGPWRAVNAVDELINGDWEDSWKHVILGGKPKEEK